MVTCRLVLWQVLLLLCGRALGKVMLLPLGVVPLTKFQQDNPGSAYKYPWTPDPSGESTFPTGGFTGQAARNNDGYDLFMLGQFPGTPLGAGNTYANVADDVPIQMYVSINFDVTAVGDTSQTPLFWSLSAVSNMATPARVGTGILGSGISYPATVASGITREIGTASSGLTWGSTVADHKADNSIGFVMRTRVASGGNPNVPLDTRLNSVFVEAWAAPDVTVASVAPTFQTGLTGSVPLTIDGQNFIAGLGTPMYRLVAGQTYTFNCTTITNNGGRINCPAPTVTLAGTYTVLISFDSGAFWTDVGPDYRVDPAGTTGTTGLSTGTTGTTGTTTGTTGTTGNPPVFVPVPAPAEESTDAGSEPSLNLGLVLGILGAILCVCVLAVVLVAAYFRKKGKFLGGADQVARVMPKKNFQALVFPADKCKPLYDMDKNSRELVERVCSAVCDPPEFTLVMALSEAVDAADRDRLSKGLAYIFGPDDCLALLYRLADEDVETSKGATTLFRADCMTSKVWKCYTQMVGMEYLYDTLARFINELMVATSEDEEGEAGNRMSSAASLMSVSTEIDPTRMGEDEDQSINKLQLSLVCQKAFHVIRQSTGLLPETFRAFFSHLRRKVEESYDEGAGRKAVGGFLFLRFICPAMMTPHIYGLTTDPPKAGFQRQLILVAKILQSLANNAEMGQKEPWMAPMQDLLKENKPRFEELFDDVSDGNDDANVVNTNRYVDSVPVVVRENSAIQVLESISREQSTLLEQLDGSLLETVQELCDEALPTKLDNA